MQKDTTRQIAVIVATVATLVVNTLASTLPLNGLDTGEISDQFEVYFVPAGYVFSIWGLIYLALIAFSIYQALPAQRENPYLRSIGYPYVASCAANIAWLFLWHYQLFALTIIAMVALLLLLIGIYLRLGIGRKRVPIAQRVLVNLPFSIYLGWITVATVANATSLLDYLNWDGWGIMPEVWAVIMLIAATLIASAVSLTRGDIAYIAVIVWAFAGIAVKHAGTTVVATTAWITAAVAALTLLAGVPLAIRRLRASGEG
jgi:hypothetical protein